MFLDDKLLKMCEDAQIENPEDIQKLNTEICFECEEYYKSQLTDFSTDKELKCILDRTFNLFDSFVRQALKSENNQLNTLGDLFLNHTFKKQFLSNEKVNEIYNKLRNYRLIG